MNIDASFLPPGGDDGYRSTLSAGGRLLSYGLFLGDRPTGWQLRVDHEAGRVWVERLETVEYSSDAEEGTAEDFARHWIEVIRQAGGYAHACAFCGKQRHEVARLIAGPSVMICNECVELCHEILQS